MSGTLTNSSSDSSLFEGPNFSSATVDGDADGFDGSLDVEGALEDDDIDEIDEIDENDEIDASAERANLATGGTAQAVLEHIARQIVDDPDAVVVDAGPGRNGLKLSLHVNPADMGRIIGKRGRVAQALRTVVRAAGARDGTDASVDIVD